jgi:thioredoxin 1
MTDDTALPVMAGGAAGTRPGLSATVVILCAEWCDVCRTFRPSLERLAAQRPDVCYTWLDIEDDAALVGDIEVENFPTVAIFRGEIPVFFGVCMPQQAVIARLVASMIEAAPVQAAVPDAVTALPNLLRTRASG